MNGRNQVDAYARLVAPANLRPGDRVRIGTRPDVLVVESVSDPLITLRHPSGATLKAGWRAIRKAAK